MNFKETHEFSKEFKKLYKKYRTLEEDLAVFKKNVLYVDVEGNKNFAVLHKSETVFIIKARFFCRYLKGRTLRVIYAYYVSEDCIEFIEVYYKGTKVNEDKERISVYLRASR